MKSLLAPLVASLQNINSSRTDPENIVLRLQLNTVVYLELYAGIQLYCNINDLHFIVICRLRSEALSELITKPFHRLVRKFVCFGCYTSQVNCFQILMIKEM